jgi:hypothetical protein
MSCIPTLTNRAHSTFSRQRGRAGEVTIMITKAALSAAMLMALPVSAFAGDRSSAYPEGSIFAAPSISYPSVAAGSSTKRDEARLSPLDPLDAPGASNLWKPSNRDAGNLTVQRWQEYYDKRAAEQGAAK